MSWLLFYLLAALHLVAFAVIGIKTDAWTKRLLLWAVLPIPAMIYCSDYFVIESKHKQLCSSEGGLRILSEPEKADRVRLVGDRYSVASAHTALEKGFPGLRVVEVMTEARGSNGERLHDYVKYRALPNPKGGMPLDHAPWKEPLLLFTEQRGESLDTGMYEISEHESTIPHGTRKETRLTRNGKVYAKYSEFVHWWTGIQYPDALPTWRCPELRKTPPKDNPNAPPQEWRYPMFGDEALIELIR